MTNQVEKRTRRRVPTLPVVMGGVQCPWCLDFGWLYESFFGEMHRVWCPKCRVREE